VAGRISPGPTNGVLNSDPNIGAKNLAVYLQFNWWPHPFTFLFNFVFKEFFFNFKLIFF